MEITTLDGFMEASQVMANVVDGIEESLAKVAGDQAKTEAAINDASAALWQKGMAHVGIALFSRIWKLEDCIGRCLESQAEDVTSPIIGLLDQIFQVQMRAFNGIRVQYIQNLRAGLGDAKDADSVKAAARAAFKGAAFPVVNLLGYHHWVKAHEALTESAKALVLTAFNDQVWPTIKDGLDALQALIPDELAKMGLQLAPLVKAVINFILNKAVTWAMKKIFLKMEELLFTQGYE